MRPAKVVVWDLIGNVLRGVRPWELWDALSQRRLLEEDPYAREHLLDLPTIFDGQPFEVVRVVDEVQLATEIVDADYLIVHKQTLPPAVLQLAQRLRLVQHMGLDYRGVHVTTARAMGVPVAATPLINYLVVAEHVWALILSHTKRLPGLRTHMASRAYKSTWGQPGGLRAIRDMTLTILGLGEIGRAIARIASGFDMQTLYWDIERFPALEASLGVTYVAWEDAFRQADVLTVQLALSDATQGIVGARELALMKPTALFVNTARGLLIDEPSLVAALAERRLGGAALDVFATEPLPYSHPLHALHEDLEVGVTLTPHCGWQSPWTWVRDSQELWFNVARAMKGEPIRHLV